MSAPFVHPLAHVADDVELDEDVKIWAFAKVFSGAKLGRGVNIGTSAYIGGGAVLGEETRIGDGAHINENQQIGKRVFICPHVCFTDDRHPVVGNKHGFIAEPVTVEDDVMVGSNATICPGVRLGRRARIAAGAVVTRDVPPGCTVVGSPAKIIRWPEDAELAR